MKRRELQDKVFKEMTLGEIHDLERRHSVSLGRSVVSEAGVRRSRALLSREKRRLMRAYSKPAKAKARAV